MSNRINSWALGLPLIGLGLGTVIFFYMQWHGTSPWLRAGNYLGPHPWLYVAVGILCGMMETGLMRFVQRRSGGRWRLLTFGAETAMMFGSYWFAIDPLVMVAFGAGLATFGVAVGMDLIDAGRWRRMT